MTNTFRWIRMLLQPSSERQHLDRRLTIVGAYMRWIEPLLFPASVIPCLALLARSDSTAFYLNLLTIPFACMALFEGNNKLLSSARVQSFSQSTPSFLLTLLISGSLALFLTAIVPLAIAGITARSPLPAVASEDAGGRVWFAATLSAIAVVFGLTVRMVLLALEEFRYSSRAYFDPTHS